jgi:hypothetical protein
MLKRLFHNPVLYISFTLLFLNCSEGPPAFIPGEDNDHETVELPVLKLHLRIHLMKDIVMTHPTGTIMDSWVTQKDVLETLMPELNSIWDQAKIRWEVESIIDEEVVKDNTYESSINYLVNCGRDEEGVADPARLSLLYSFMQPAFRSKTDELNGNLFHIYLFPFIGNTSQGNAMRDFNYHCVLGTWSNKHNDGTIPEKTLLVEYHNQFVRGSLSRTAAHELGHVLSLKHNECSDNCLMSGGSDGYLLTKVQINTARLAAYKRL